MKKFAKLYELGSDAQVLIDLTINASTEVYKVVVKTNNSEGTFVTTMNFEDEKFAVQGFNTLDYEWAIDFHQSVKI